MTGMTIDTNEVLAIAGRIESDNIQLRNLLDTSKARIDSLTSYWQGQAASATQDAYTDFANRFFQQYQDILQQYVTFLRRNVAEQYSETEVVNTQLSDAFK